MNKLSDSKSRDFYFETGGVLNTSVLSLAKSVGELGTTLEKEKDDEVAQGVAILKFLSDNNEIDFERMIQLSTKILDIDSSGDKSFVSKFDHVLVDEFQDINYSQKVMIDHILKGGANYWVVGDDDQAIYGWRGSDVKFILGFENDYPGASKVNLVKNIQIKIL